MSQGWGKLTAAILNYSLIATLDVSALPLLAETHKGWRCLDGPLSSTPPWHGLLQVFGGPWKLDGTWRFALAFGCFLNILTIYFRWCAVGRWGKQALVRLGVGSRAAIRARGCQC